MKRKFKGKCKNCPYGEKVEEYKNILCEFGGIRDLESNCNILVLGNTLFKVKKKNK